MVREISENLAGVRDFRVPKADRWHATNQGIRYTNTAIGFGKIPVTVRWMDDVTFQKRADESLEDLFQALNDASDEYEIEADMNGGALSVEFEEPKTKFVVSPNSPVRQIWVSANVKSYKLDWNEASGAFVLPATGQTLKQLMADAIGELLDEEVEL